MKPIVRLGVRIAFACGLLAVLFRFVPAGAVLDTVASMHPMYLIAGLALQYVVRAITAVRMKLIAEVQGVRMTLATIWRILLVTQFYSMLLPGPVVGGGATWLKYVQHGADGNAAAATILLSRGVGVLMMVIVGASAWIIDARQSYAWALAAVLGATVVLIALADGRWSALAGGALSVSTSRIARAYVELRRRLRLFADIRRARMLVILATSLANEVAAAAVMWCFAMAAGLELQLVTVLWMRAALQLVLLLPLTIAGLGLREASLVGLGALVGVPAHTALTWSLTIFAGTLVVAASGGIIEASSVSNGMLRSFGAGGRHAAADGEPAERP